MEFLTPLHPLLRAMAADARRRLLQVYAGVRGLPPRRLSLRLVSAAEPASIVFTFLGRIHAGGVVLEERLLLARVDARPEVLGTTASCRTWLELPSAAGDAPWSDVERSFSASFAAMRARAAESALNEARIRAEELRQRRSAEVEQWLRHLEVDTRDRLRELQEQAERQRGLIEASTNQRLLFTEEGSSSAEIATRRAAVEERASVRRAELESYRSIELLGAPEPLGACILWPAAEQA
jgi:flagellar motility protein MotE (MotC chaperone)